MRTEEEGRAVVEALVREGAGFVKVYSRLTADTYFAISSVPAEYRKMVEEYYKALARREAASRKP